MPPPIAWMNRILHSPAIEPRDAVTRRKIASQLLVMAAYLIAGRLGLMLAPLSGYASAIFPAAGVAVTAVFIAGGAMLPGLFAASFLLELWFALTFGHGASTLGTLTALIFAAFPTARAAMGVSPRRFPTVYPPIVDNGRYIGRFAFPVPLPCLATAGLPVGGLLLRGIFNRHNAPWNWISWWAGDTIGVLIMFPLIMVAFGRPRALWRSRIRTVAIPMVVFSALFIAIFVKADEWGRANSLSEFRIMSQEASDRTAAHLHEQAALLEQMASLFSSHIHVTRGEFRNFVQRALARYSIVQALEWAPKVDAARRAAFEAAQQRTLAGFRITEHSGNNRMKPAADRPYYYPVTYLQPVAGNRAAIGYDLASNPKRLAAIADTNDRQTVTATAPLRLVQEKNNQVGILLMLAVNHGGNGSGVVLSVLRMGDFIQGILKSESSALYTRVIDQQSGIVLYDDFSQQRLMPSYSDAIRFGSREYLIQTAPTPAYLAGHREWESWSVLASGLLFTALLGALLLLGSGYTARVEALVDTRTAELRKSESRLSEAQRIAHLGSWEVDIPRGDMTWSHETQRIFETIPGSARTPYEAFIAAIHPQDRERVQQSYQRAQTARTPYDTEYRLLMHDGRIKFIHEQCRVYHDADGRAMRLVGTVQDVTEHRAAEQSLRESEQRFRSALDYAPNGIALLSTEGYFGQVNNALCVLLGYDDNEIKGTALQKHTCPADRISTDTVIERLLHSRSPSQRLEMRMVRKDGRMIWVQMTISLVRDGQDEPSYFIAQFEDITERKNAQEQIHQLAYYDALTGLPNRRLLLDRLGQALIQARRHERTLAVMFLDLDEFKQINDTLGHDVGDALLKVVAGRMVNAVRSGDVVARQGGDEFIIVLTEISDVDAATMVAEKIIEKCRDPIEVGKNQLRISTSIGIAVLPENGTDDATVLMKKADIAMYRAKEAGRNTYRFYET